MEEPCSSMVEPCNCLGEYQYVHVDCWGTWLHEDLDKRDMGCQRCESNWKMDTEEKIEKVDVAALNASDLPEEFKKAAMSDRLERALYTAWFRITTKQASEREKRILRDVGAKIPGPWTKWVTQDAQRRNSFMGKVGSKIEEVRDRRQSLSAQRSLSMGKAAAGSLQRRPSLQLRRPSLFGGNRDQVFQVCRICGQNDEVLNLVEPCHCTDKELKFVHINCWQKHVRPEEGEDELQTNCELCEKPWKVDPSMQFNTQGETEDPDAPEVSDRLMRALECAWFRVSTGQAGAREFGILADAGAKVKGPWDSWVRKQGKKGKKGEAEDLLNGDQTKSTGRGKCRICLESAAVSTLVAPCKCSGEQEFMHADCWVKFVRDDPERRLVKCLMCQADWTMMPDLVEYGAPEAEVSQRLMRALQTAWFRISTGACGPTELELVTQAGPEVPGPWTKWLEERDKRRNSVGGRMVRSMSIGAGAGARRPSFQGGSAQANANAIMDPVEAAKMASLAAEGAEDAEAAEEAKKSQLKLSRQVSRGRRMRNAPKRLSTLGESMHERGSIIMKRARILLLGDPTKAKNESKGLLSCCMGGGKAAKYEVDPEPEDKKGDSAEEDEW